MQKKTTKISTEKWLLEKINTSSEIRDLCITF